MSKTYSVKSIFGPTLQGEGHRAGTPTMFIRFAGCNLQCVDGPRLLRPLREREVDVGFFCDTDFAKGSKMDVAAILHNLEARWPSLEGRAVVISGGEPTLQLDVDLVDALHRAGWYVSVETNGSRSRLDCRALGLVQWISCSPKGTDIRLTRADEVRCVVAAGQEPNDHGIEARWGVNNDDLHRFVSPRFESTVAEFVSEFVPPPAPDRADLNWAIMWCFENPGWRLSVQQHKLWAVE